MTSWRILIRPWTRIHSYTQLRQVTRHSSSSQSMCWSHSARWSPDSVVCHGRQFTKVPKSLLSSRVCLLPLFLAISCHVPHPCYLAAIHPSGLAQAFSKLQWCAWSALPMWHFEAAREWSFYLLRGKGNWNPTSILLPRPLALVGGCDCLGKEYLFC
jgi:hypothetical protein